MSVQAGDNLLEQDIACIMRARRAAGRTAQKTGSQPVRILATGMVIALLQPHPLWALSLGELEVHSNLGQPLDASTTARIGSGETLDPGCISVLPNGPDSLAAPQSLRITTGSHRTPGEYPVQIRSTRAMYEPMYEFRLQVKCPGTVAVSRNYTFMLNLPLTATTLSGTSPSAPIDNRNAAVRAAALTRTASTPAPVPASNTLLQASNTGIPAGSRYRVRSADTLSTIAARIQGRLPDSIWKVADLLFATNPQAFIRNNPDGLKLGSVLQIPDITELTGVFEDTATPGNATIAAGAPGLPDTQAATPLTAGRPEQEVGTGPSGAVLRGNNRPPVTELQALADNPVATTGTVTTAITAQQAESSPMPTEPTTGEITAAIETGPEAVSEPFVDVRPANDTVQPAAAAGISGAVTTAVASDAAMPATPPRSGVSNMLAVGVGVVIGFLLSLLLLGRGLLQSLGQRKTQAYDSLPDIDWNAAPPAAKAAQHETADNASAAPAMSTRYKNNGGIEVSMEPYDDNGETNNDDEMDQRSEYTEQLNQPAAQTPRVSLRQPGSPEFDPDESPTTALDGFDDFAALLEDDLATSAVTPESVDLDFSTATAKGAGLEADEGTGTIHRLFNAPHEGDEGIHDDEVTTELDSGSESLTVELPEIDSAANDLESLSRRLADRKNDDQLSATLTQALELLEKDYEEELTASQVVSREDAEAALSTKKSGH